MEYLQPVVQLQKVVQLQRVVQLQFVSFLQLSARLLNPHLQIVYFLKF